MEIEIVQPIIAMFTYRRRIERHLEANTCNFGFWRHRKTRRFFFILYHHKMMINERLCDAQTISNINKFKKSNSHRETHLIVHIKYTYELSL